METALQFNEGFPVGIAVIGDNRDFFRVGRGKNRRKLYLDEFESALQRGLDQVALADKFQFGSPENMMYYIEKYPRLQEIFRQYNPKRGRRVRHRCSKKIDYAEFARRVQRGDNRQELAEWLGYKTPSSIDDLMAHDPAAKRIWDARPGNPRK